ncbi:hypoxia-inducible factor 3 alpha [Trichinella spiralis]|uniref:hypoxia-inducible factor 3 alpha n=1 Tax=Trichinella spiralis TaxID=6334 RepID=UPI0001EFB36C|nr:hypoxia-inducible factor 3 alpha [Trichinella spiralis]
MILYPTVDDQTDLIGRSLFEYVHPDDAVDLNQAFQTCDENAEERSLILRVKSALSARGRSIFIYVEICTIQAAAEFSRHSKCRRCFEKFKSTEKKNHWK